jgi:hypothetical protein
MKDFLKLLERTRDFSATNYRITFGWSGVSVEHLPSKTKIRLAP